MITSENTRDELLDLGVLEDLANLSRGQGASLLDQLFDLFCAQGPASIVILRQALATRNLDEILETAHSLKGSYRSLGTSRLASLSEQLEAAARQQDLTACDRLTDRLELDYPRTREALENFVRSHA